MSARDAIAAQPARRRSRSKRHAVARLQLADRELAELLPLHEVDAIAALAEQAAGAGDDSARLHVSSLTGDALPSDVDMARIRRDNLMRAFAQRRALLADALSVGEVAALLGVGRQTPHDRVKAGTFLAVKENGRLAFPQWQFDPEGPDGVLAGLPDVLRTMNGRPISDLGRVRWFVTAKALLDGRTPLDALRAGDIDHVLAEAESIGVS